MPSPESAPAQNTDDTDPFVLHAADQAVEAIGAARSDPTNPNLMKIAIASILGALCAGASAARVMSLYAMLAAY